MGDLFSAISGSSKKAAKKQAQAADSANTVAFEQMNAALDNFKPYLDSGTQANSELNTYLGLPSGDSTSANYGELLKPFTGDDLASTPGYQFGLQQGQQALDRKQASGGNYLSGAAVKEGQRFAQDYAGTKFQEGYNRDATDKSRVQNFLSSVASLGQNAANSVGTLRQNYSNAYGQNTIGKGNAQAAGIMGQANAIGGAINTGLGLATFGLGANGYLGGGVQNMLGAGSPSPGVGGAGLNPAAYSSLGSGFNSMLPGAGFGSGYSGLAGGSILPMMF